MFKISIIFLTIFCFNMLFYAIMYDDFSIASYVLSENAWQDQVIFFNESNSNSSEVRLLAGVNLYSVFMYSIFNESMMGSIVINSIIFSISISILSKFRKSYDTLYFMMILPFIAYFSIGFTKESLIILGLALFYRYILVENFKYLFFSICILMIARPLYVIPIIVLSIYIVRKNIKASLFVLLLLTPLFFWSIKLVFINSYYVERFDNLENMLRMYIPFFSVFGNFIALLKSYGELLFTPIFEQELQYYTLLIFLFVNALFLILNISRVLKSEVLIFVFILFVITMGPISHFRYLTPVLFIIGYLVLPDRVRVADSNYRVKGYI